MFFQRMKFSTMGIKIDAQNTRNLLKNALGLIESISWEMRNLTEMIPKVIER